MTSSAAALREGALRLQLASRHRAVAVGVILLGAYAATRLALLVRFPPFWDESLYASWALRVHEDVGARWVALGNGKLPLLSWLGAAVMAAHVEPLDATRVVSFAAGAVSLAGGAFVARQTTDRQLAVVAAAALYIVLPLALVHDTIGLMEPLVGAELITAFVLQIRLARRPSIVTGACLGVTFAAAILTKETGYLAIALLPLSLAALPWRSPERRLNRWMISAGVSLVFALAGYGLLRTSGVWSVYKSTQLTFGTVRSFSQGIAHPIRWLDEAWPGYRPELSGYVTWPIGALALLGLLRSLRRRRVVGLLCAVWLMALFTTDVLFLTNSFVRYIVPGAPFVAALAGGGVYELHAALGSLSRSVRSISVVLPPLIVLIALPALKLDSSVLRSPSTAPYPGVSIQEYEIGWSAGTGVDALVRALRARARSRPITVTWYGHLSPQVFTDLRNDHSISFLESDGTESEEAGSANYVVINDLPLPSQGGLGDLRLDLELRRPHDGVPLLLYERGIAWQHRFFTSAAGLRSGLGLDDRRFDAFVAAHPAIRRWYLAVSPHP